MRNRWLPAALVLMLLFAGGLRADLKRALAEPNLEKRSALALDNAAAALKEARDAYDRGDDERTAQCGAEILDSVNLAEKSLVDSGKNPRMSTWFKKAEIATRDLSRRLDAFLDQMNYADRSMFDGVKARLMEVHDSLLKGVMEGRKKK